MGVVSCWVTGHLYGILVGWQLLFINTVVFIVLLFPFFAVFAFLLFLVFVSFL